MKIFGYSVEECITFFMLVVVGYFIAKLFSQKCNGFSVGAQITCEGATQSRCTKYLSKHNCEWKDGNCTNKNPPGPVKCEGKNIKLYKTPSGNYTCQCKNAPLGSDPTVKCSYKCKDTNGKITEMNPNEKLSVCNSLDSDDLCHHRLHNNEVLASDVTISGCP